MCPTSNQSDCSVGSVKFSESGLQQKSGTILISAVQETVSKKLKSLVFRGLLELSKSQRLTRNVRTKTVKEIGWDYVTPYKQGEQFQNQYGI